MISNPY